MKAQQFMNDHRISVCYEADGILFKHRDNAEARAAVTGSELIVHELNAGTKPVNSNN